VGAAMTGAWDRFLGGFGEGEPDAKRPDETSIFEQLDALHDERVERHDPHWFPPGPDPQGLERLVRERYERGKHRSRSRP
jgi:hypothetical protein